MKQKIRRAVVYNALYLLFGDYYEKSRLSKCSIDENNATDFSYSLKMKYKTIQMEDFIRDLWGNNSQYVLSGILIYLMKLDPYFSPEFNNFQDFFVKIYRHSEILGKIGQGKHKVIFPFKKYIRENKKLILIRC